MSRLADRPTLTLKPDGDRRLRAGHPWIFSNEFSAAHKGLEPGDVVRVADARGKALGTFFYNPHSLIAARLLSRDSDAAIGEDFLRARIEAAIALREKFFATRHHRLVHAEADGLPGLIIDRYDDVFAVQANTAGMDRLLPELTEVLADLGPRAIVAKNDSPARKQEGLLETVGLLAGRLDGPASVEEGGVSFSVDLLGGQKTGWFYDQRFNRDAVAALAHDATVLDAYCHTGAFGLRAARAGAARVTLLDRSAHALALASETAAANGLEATTLLGEVFDELARLGGRAEKFDLVIADPPAFVKARKDFDAGIRGYGKLASLAAPLVARGGFLFIASCSHHCPVDVFAQQIAWGLQRSGRAGRILRSAGAGPDHPVHPMLPESAYLKGLLLQLD